ncbi:tetratricopeptide repeat protein [Nitrosomonas sp.]|uniref:tetratricopeptide repeat protein n=1 Tax=Nitrosomonas sp. TaxID=42353 RepID=UPI0032EEC41F
MKLIFLCCLLLISSFAFPTYAEPSQLQQSIDGNSGIALQAGGNISNVNLTIIHGSADYQKLKQAFDKAKRYLDKDPSDPDFARDYQVAKKELEDFTSQILKLAKEIDKIPLNSERGKKAKQLFEKGDYQAAREVLDEKEMVQEKQALLKKKEQDEKELAETTSKLNDLAADYLLKARLTALDYQFGERRISQTRQFFEQALELGRTHERLFEYAIFLQNNNQFDDSEKFYREALEIRRDLAKANPAVYRPDVAMTLNNLGVLVKTSGRRDEAEKLNQEALKTYRELAKANPAVYLPYVAGTLNNLGNLVKADSSRQREAETLYQEALTIRRELAKDNPAVYRPDVATALNNLGVLVADDSGRRDEAEKLYREALAIRRELAKDNPAVYRPDVATTLNNLGVLVADDSGRRDEAEKLYREALAIRRELAKANPAVYLFYMAMTLNNLGILVAADSGRRDEAETLFQEALKTYQELAKNNPDVYRPDVANILESLGSAHLKWQQPKKALPYLQESVELYTVLNQQAPQVYGERLKLVKQLLQDAKNAQ